MRSFRNYRLVSSLLLAASVVAQVPAPIVADQIKGDLSFLASDELAGRYSPSPELQIAAEFVASRFRAMGLAPLPSGTYFQNARMIDRNIPKPVEPVSFRSGEREVSIAVNDYFLLNTATQVDLMGTPVVFFAGSDVKTLSKIDAKGKVLVILHLSSEISRAVQLSGAAAVVYVNKSHSLGSHPLLFEAEEITEHSIPVLSARSGALAEQAEKSNAGDTWTFSGRLPGANDRQVTLANVGGVVPGSDPTLKSEVVLVTAHYDHIGTGQTAAPFSMTGPTPNDQIYNGADDDGSGTVSVIAIANSLRRAHPKRSLLFMVFFGEERGLIGSEYYTRHPEFPLLKTVADINLEQVGRIDELDGGAVTPRPKSLTLTGYRFTNLAQTIRQAGLIRGVNVYENKENSDPFFLQSDNAALSIAGIPSTTVCTAFEFPDYHAVGDEWQKIDYPNMALIDRTMAQAVLTIADSAARPRWNEDNPKTAEYRAALEALKKAQ